jgi:UDP:flavonoid glycosyltransferase YjiC (YdhE family)
MRVLVTTWAWPTHYTPLVALGWAFRADGHEVLVASQPSMAGHIRRSGLPGISIGEDAVIAEVSGRLLRQDRQARGRADRSRTVAHYAEMAELMLDPLLRLIEDWSPGLVVFEETTYAASLAAAYLGIPAARHLWGVDIMSFIRGSESWALERLLGRLGLADPGTDGIATVDHCPPSLQVPASYPRLLMRYVPFNGSGTVPRWVAAPAARPRVCVTYGTTSAQVGDYQFVVDRIVGALGQLDVDVVVTLADSDRRRLGAVPPNVRVSERLPLHALLPGCDLIVSQGGPGTMLTAAACGTPQLIIPQLTDQKLIGAMVAATGAGSVLDLGQADPGRIAGRAAQMLASRDYPAAADRLRAEIERQPAPLAVARELIALASAAACSGTY